MTKGRKKLPTQLKAIKGTLQKCRENHNEPNLQLMKELPEPPEYFNEYARKVYLETGLELINNGIMSRVDFDIFLIYITELAKYKDAQIQINKTANVLKIDDKPAINPYIRVAEKSFQILMRVACEFGLTPAARSKVNSIKQEVNNGDEFFK